MLYTAVFKYLAQLRRTTAYYVAAIQQGVALWITISLVANNDPEYTSFFNTMDLNTSREIITDHPLATNSEVPGIVFKAKSLTVTKNHR
jgi:hypothetical protein